MRNKLALGILGIALIAIFAPSGSAFADQEQELLPTFGIRPASGGAADPNTGTFFHYVLDPGTSVSDEALVLNLGETPIRLSLYAADGDTAVNGGATFTRPGEGWSGVRHWLSTDVSDVALDPEERTLVTFTVRVPSNVDPGDWVAGWVVEAPPKPGPGGVGVDIIERAGVAVVVHVPGSSRPALTLDQACYNGEAGSNYFQMRVTNPGNVLSRASGTFTLFGAQDTVVFERPADLGAVIPGDETVLRVDSPLEPPPGEYVAAAVLRRPDGAPLSHSSLVRVEGSASNGCQVTVTAGEEEGPRPVVPGLPGGGFPRLLLIALLAAVLAAILAARHYLRRRARGNSPPAA